MIPLSPYPPHISGSSCLSSLQKVWLFQPALIHLVEEGTRQTRREGREDETSRTIDEGEKKKGGSRFDKCSCRAKGSMGHRH